MFNVSEFAINIGENIDETNCAILYSSETAFVWIGSLNSIQKPIFKQLIYAIENKMEFQQKTGQPNVLSCSILNKDDIDYGQSEELAKRLTKSLHIPIFISINENYTMLTDNQVRQNEIMHIIESSVHNKLLELLHS